ncbi:hypothetical protein ACFWJW_00635 [Streptomyces sp. NPDC127097]|uniref:hypothetical protein n=1 Tax=Streptomyces sp. NPDC127097 TaxID=3347136 RepID=UPI00364EEF65
MAKLYMPLAAAGLILIAVAIAGFFLSLDSTAIGLILTIGAFLFITSAFYYRIEGRIDFPGGSGFSVKAAAARQSIRIGEIQLDLKEVTDAEELTP